MMRCSCAQCRFSAFLDRDLDDDEEVELREHLSQCPECAAELAALKETLGALHALPGVEPGAGFYAGVQKLIHDAGDCFAGERARRPALSRLVPDLSRVWLRPAIGAALGLLAGVIVTASSPQIVALLGGEPAMSPTSPEVVYQAVADQLAEPHVEGSPSSPLAGIDLPPLRGAADSMNVVNEPEYVLEPYVADPNRGLVPVGQVYGKSFGNDADAQSDVFVTF